MDLIQIGKKLEERSYKSKEEFEYDMNLVFDNCIQYHGQDSGEFLICKRRFNFHEIPTLVTGLN